MTDVFIPIFFLLLPPFSFFPRLIINRAPSVLKAMLTHEAQAAEGIDTLFRHNTIGTKALDMCVFPIYSSAFTFSCGSHFKVYEACRS